MAIRREPDARPDQTLPRSAPLGERLLMDAVQRSLRRGQGQPTLALVLHLSRLDQPAPQPHHHRIARAILQDAAQQQDGQVFAMANGDLVLVCRDPAAGPDRAAGGFDPATLPDQLCRLFRLDAARRDRLLSHWRSTGPLHQLLAYTVDRLAEAPALAEPPADEAGPPAAIDAVATLLAGSRIDDLLHRQTGVLVGRTRGSETLSLRPLYRELTFSSAALEARVRTLGRAEIDPYLFRHLVSRFDGRMLETLVQARDADGPLGLAPDGCSLHLNLTVPTILSSGFETLLTAMRQRGAALAVEISLVEAVADPPCYLAARQSLRRAGVTLVLDGVSELALRLSRPWTLAADLVKLDWSPRLAEAGTDDQAVIADALGHLEPRRVILQRAESEAALRWGMAHGIQRFQGRHVDAMLGASRIAACPRADGCTLRQCIERAATLSPAGRSGCRNHALLDAGAADVAATLAAA